MNWTLFWLLWNAACAAMNAELGQPWWAVANAFCAGLLTATYVDEWLRA